MRWKYLLFYVMITLALVSLVFVWTTVLRHADGAEAIASVDLHMTEVELVSDEQLQLEFEVCNDSETTVEIETIRFVARKDDNIAAMRSEKELMFQVAGNSEEHFSIEVNPASDYEDIDMLRQLPEADPDSWYVSGYMKVRPLRSRARERVDFEILGIQEAQNESR